MRLSWSGESKISCTGLCACGVAGGRGADASRGLLGFSGPGGGVVATLGKKRNKCSEQSVGGNYVGKRFHVQHLTTHRFIEQETSPNSGTAGSAAKRCLIHTARAIPTANTPGH